MKTKQFLCIAPLCVAACGTANTSAPTPAPADPASTSALPLPNVKLDGALLTAFDVEPGHQVAIYTLRNGTVAIRESFPVGQTSRLAGQPIATLADAYRLARPGAEVPQSVVDVDALHGAEPQVRHAPVIDSTICPPTNPNCHGGGTSSSGGGTTYSSVNATVSTGVSVAKSTAPYAPVPPVGTTLPTYTKTPTAGTVPTSPVPATPSQASQFKATYCTGSTVVCEQGYGSADSGVPNNQQAATWQAVALEGSEANFPANLVGEHWACPATGACGFVNDFTDTLTPGTYAVWSDLYVPTFSGLWSDFHAYAFAAEYMHVGSEDLPPTPTTINLAVSWIPCGGPGQWTCGGQCGSPLWPANTTGTGVICDSLQSATIECPTPGQLLTVGDEDGYMYMGVASDGEWSLHSHVHDGGAWGTNYGVGFAWNGTYDPSTGLEFGTGNVGSVGGHQDSSNQDSDLTTSGVDQNIIPEEFYYLVHGSGSCTLETSPNTGFVVKDVVITAADVGAAVVLAVAGYKSVAHPEDCNWSGTSYICH